MSSSQRLANRNARWRPIRGPKPAVLPVRPLPVLEGGRTGGFVLIGRGPRQRWQGKGRALREEFTAKKYHQPKDEWSESLDFTGTAKDVALIYNVGRSLANSGKWPEWKAGSEFKALRDKSGSKRK